LRPAELPGVEILLAQHSSRRWCWFHETYSICTVISRRGAKVGHVQFYEPGDAHSNAKVLHDAEFRVLFISPERARAAAEELGCPAPRWKVFATADAQLHGSMVAFHSAIESQADRLEVESRFAACTRRLFGDFAEKSPAPVRRPARGALLRARDVIRAAYSKPLALDDLSRVAHLSRYHFARAFAAEFGLPPHAYQMQLRVRRAQHLLGTGNSMAEVAAETGFCDQSHFTRHFKRLVGVTPSRYAQMVTRRECPVAG